MSTLARPRYHRIETMDANELNKFRRLLEAQKQELIAEGDIKLEPVRRDAVTAADEDEQPLAEMTQSIASKRNRERARTIAAIDAALAKIDDEPDDFGLCEDCEEDIADRRLEAMPHARLCIRCKSRREADATPGSRKHLTDYS